MGRIHIKNVWTGLIVYVWKNYLKNSLLSSLDKVVIFNDN